MTGVLIVDGGQSGIRARHSAASRVVEVEGVSRLEGDVVAAVAARVAEAWRELGSPATDRVGLGLTTADEAAGDRLLALVVDATGASEAWLCDDTVTTHAGALSGGWGVSLVAGTGVACLAVPESGAPVVVDGHGYLLGDDGAGFWIGREGVRAVLRSVDGRGGPTALADAARERFGALDSLHVRLHEIDRPVNVIAQFAPEVVRLAATDDTAARILDEAADELARTAAAAVRAASGVGLWAAADDAVVPLAIGGRLLEAGTPLRSRLDSRLPDAAPRAAPRDADAGPLDGGFLVDADPSLYTDLIHRFRKDPSHV